MTPPSEVHINPMSVDMNFQIKCRALLPSTSPFKSPSKKKYLTIPK